MASKSAGCACASLSKEADGDASAVSCSCFDFFRHRILGAQNHKHPEDVKPGPADNVRPNNRAVYLTLRLTVSLSNARGVDGQMWLRVFVLGQAAAADPTFAFGFPV